MLAYAHMHAHARTHARTHTRTHLHTFLPCTRPFPRDSLLPAAKAALTIPSSAEALAMEAVAKAEVVLLLLLLVFFCTGVVVYVNVCGDFSGDARCVRS